jgi:tRNA A-37 threonylcarbamoyl transferase component Bud32
VNKLPPLRSTIFQGFDADVKDEAKREAKASAEAPDAHGKLPTIGDIVDDHYILVRLLGEGAFAKVYFAQRIDIPEHQVALKIFPKVIYEGRNVERELVMLATVGHPNVVQLKDHGTGGDDYVWLTMPVYQGETLEERLKRGALSMREAYDIFVPVARGLEALHAAGLRHQDIKPDNIYLAQFGGRVHPILLDLGAAAECDATFVAGTLLYASPEQIAYLAGKPEGAVLTEKMDSYGLATTLLMALVGPDNFAGVTAETAEEIEQAHRKRAEHPILDTAMPDLKGRARELFQQAMKRWLAIDPKVRPSISKLADELDVLLEPEREEARAEERRRMRQKAALQRVRLAVAGLLAMAAAGAFFMYSKRETLALASQLERAQKEGAESFDKLDTCVASHALEKSAALSCREARKKDESEYQATLDAVKKAGSETVAERARQIEKLQSIFAARLKSTEEAGAAALKKASDERAQERAQLEASCSSEKQALMKERDEQKQLHESRTTELELCTTARKACISELETWRTATAAGAQAAAPSPGQAPAAVGQAPAAVGQAPAAADHAPGAPAAPADGAPAAPGTAPATASPPPAAPPAAPPAPAPAPKRVDPTEI